ncbi:hypothetical protein QR680_004617 [Steinernema hermaphroditum]|uniref:TIL domain-containing protein n=1 Tax=Steinernema hermaphroditum TaxID=289476 RepID=A0AA39HRF9_9BILA|nr:hypothetical protein QR680_004617 [Steinernema hermaphroditum]
MAQLKRSNRARRLQSTLRPMAALRLRFSIFLCSALCLVAVNASGTDCQDNEIYVLCGQCEGTCVNPHPRTCFPGCIEARCECVKANGFVRAHDGKCIKAEDCPLYPLKWANEEYYGGYISTAKTEAPGTTTSTPAPAPAPVPVRPPVQYVPPPPATQAPAPPAPTTPPQAPSNGILSGIIVPTPIHSARNVPSQPTYNTQ